MVLQSPPWDTYMDGPYIVDPLPIHIQQVLNDSTNTILPIKEKKINNDIQLELKVQRELPPSEHSSRSQTRTLTAFLSAGILMFRFKITSDIPYAFSLHLLRKEASVFNWAPFESAPVRKRWFKPTTEAWIEPRNSMQVDHELAICLAWISRNQMEVQIWF